MKTIGLILFIIGVSMLSTLILCKFFKGAEEDEHETEYKNREG